MLDASQFFSENFYLSQNLDVAAAVNAGSLSSGLQHFNSFGQFEGRDPSLLFSNTFYLQQNSDVAAAVNGGFFRSGFEHFLLFGQFEGRDSSQLFNTQYYLAQNADVAAAVATTRGTADPLTGIEHFLLFGQFESRNPSQQFNNRFYLDSNSDVATAVNASPTDPLTGIKHFLDFGALEGRSPSLLFNNGFYLQQNQDVAAAVNNGFFRSSFLHFTQFGIAEQRFGSDLAFNPPVIYVSNNGAGNVGEVDRVNGIFAGQRRFLAGNNEGVDLDILGNLYQAGDVTPGAGTIRVISQIGNRSDNDSFSPIRDRQLGGPQTGLVNPKGFAIAQTAGYIIVANNGAQNLKVFGTAAGGDVPPVATNPLPANAWDVVYDENADRLFVALVNGDISVFDNYIGNGSNIGGGGISRTIIPANASGNKVSTNLHGIVYEPTLDKLVVTDVGAATAAQSPNFANDGRIYVIDNASTANGNVLPSRTIEGSRTQLGNPVDLILDGNNVQVAEKAKNQLLIFSNIFTGADGNVTPDISVPEIGPESLVADSSSGILNPDVTNIESPTTLINAVFATSNPATPTATTEFVTKLSPNLQNTLSVFNTSGGVPTVENITFDLTGDAFITFDSGSDTNGGILIVNRLAESRNNGTFNPSRDRSIAGANTGLVAPKGLDVADSLGLVFVAENNAATPAILAFSTQAQGDVAPVFKTTNLAGRRPWDVDYEPTSDRLFVAATDGSVLIYDQYAATQGVNGPTRTIIPSNAVGTKVSINLHGIIYVAAADTLLLSDVGSAMSATDGQLFTIPNASSANGNVAVRTQIAGANTLLGNPVDVTFDGANLYVAEKSNDRILRFDNILAQSGGLDIAPSLALASNKPESVALSPDYLSARA